MRNSDKLTFLKLLRKYFDFVRLFIKKNGSLGLLISKIVDLFKTKGIKGVIKKTKYIITQAKSGKLAFTDDIKYTNWLNAYHQTSQKDILRMQNSVLYIEDTGKGIKNPSKVFERFYKEQERGIGIGLHIVKKLCEELGIEITLQSEIGQGTSFFLNLKPLTLC